MSRIGYAVRRVGMVAAGLVCIAAGAAFAFGLLRSGGVATASDAELAAVVALFVLPALTMGAMRLEASIKRNEGPGSGG
ncbi:MAG: hypothetical protein RIB60_00400 [Phycisphaerales bacterium]